MRLAVMVSLILLLAAVTSAQRGRPGDFGDFGGALGNRIVPAPNAPYNGKFAFVRLTYDSLPGGYWYRGQPAWSHGYPASENNLNSILG
jgi:hypothetical protein